MGREARAREAREIRVTIIHDHHPDPSKRKTRVEFSPPDPVMAFRIMALGVSALADKVQPLEEKEKSLIAKPNAAGVKKFARTLGGP